MRPAALLIIFSWIPFLQLATMQIPSYGNHGITYTALFISLLLALPGLRLLLKKHPIFVSFAGSLRRFSTTMSATVFFWGIPLFVSEIICRPVSFFEMTPPERFNHGPFVYRAALSSLLLLAALWLFAGWRQKGYPLAFRTKNQTGTARRPLKTFASILAIATVYAGIILTFTYFYHLPGRQWQIELLRILIVLLTMFSGLWLYIRKGRDINKSETPRHAPIAPIVFYLLLPVLFGLPFAMITIKLLGNSFGIFFLMSPQMGLVFCCIPALLCGAALVAAWKNACKEENKAIPV
ncbi:MAG: hypothetical protein GY765_26570, partial [bacterium]|nr:hypothetical protein [bacterium]